MAVFTFTSSNILHFRFIAGLVYSGSLNIFKGQHGIMLPIRGTLKFNPLFSNGYRGLTEKRHPLSYMS